MLKTKKTNLYFLLEYREKKKQKWKKLINDKPSNHLWHMLYLLKEDVTLHQTTRWMDSFDYKEMSHMLSKMHGRYMR